MQFQKNYKELNLPLKVQEDKIIEGWVDKPKGSLQVLFECECINPDQLKLYTKDGCKNPNDTTQNPSNVDHSPIQEDQTGCNFFITELMKLQTDFLAELTLLQFHALKLGDPT